MQDKAFVTTLVSASDQDFFFFNTNGLPGMHISPSVRLYMYGWAVGFWLYKNRS